MLLLTAGALAIIFTLWATIRARDRNPLPQRVDKRVLLFLLLTIPMALAPVLIFSPHPSESYLYFPAALYAMFVSLLLWDLFRSRRTYLAVMVVLLICYGGGTWLRNERVAACGLTAERIINQLPTSKWANGSWRIVLANAPGEPVVHRYGIYRYQGLSTIDPSIPQMVPSTESDDIAASVPHNIIQMALRFASGNSEVQAAIVNQSGMDRSCVTSRTCFVVFRNGYIQEWPPEKHPSSRVH